MLKNFIDYNQQNSNIKSQTHTEYIFQKIVLYQ